MRKTLKAGDAMPMWYACAWFDYYRYEKVAYPIGIHFITRYARQFYIWIVWFYYHKDIKNISKALDEGYDIGYKAGYAAAVSEGPTIIRTTFTPSPKNQ